MKSFQFSVPIIVHAETQEQANYLLMEYLEKTCDEDKETGKFMLKEKTRIIIN